MKIADLTGQELDYWVARALGWNGQPPSNDFAFKIEGTQYRQNEWCPSRSWEQAGPIIERERISLHLRANGEFVPVGPGWQATILFPTGVPRAGGTGPTPLIAAMRCFVASKFNEEVLKGDQNGSI